MRSLDELKNFYDTILYPELNVLEAHRIKARNKILIAAAIILPVALFVLMYIAKNASGNSLFFVGMIVFFVLGGIYHFATKEYVQNFKTGIIEKLVKFIDQNLEYSRNNHISQTAFMNSKIFNHNPDRFNGDDYVKGKIGQTNLEFSELHAKYITRDSKGRTQEHTIFKGLFFIADFNKKFNGKTIILPDTAERIFGQLGTMLQSMNKFRGQLIRLEDPEFERMFAVYGDDQIEARYILSTSLMKRITDFKRRTSRTIYLSFVGSKIYIAVSCLKDLFEPRVFRTMLDFTPIKEYFEDLQMAVSIVEELNLNTRIWTKE
ncbi:MAG: DUF3137 domain-containing protein [Candidatus Omnitrophica bacterium]|nr:DUF3137 domain-containing protein [Candidatus Omnitrophota bacterium]